MKLKAAVMKVFAPAVAQYGFSLKYLSGRGCYDFYTEDKSKHIRIDIEMLLFAWSTGTAQQYDLGNLSEAFSR